MRWEFRILLAPWIIFAIGLPFCLLMPNSTQLSFLFLFFGTCVGFIPWLFIAPRVARTTIRKTPSDYFFKRMFLGLFSATLSCVILGAALAMTSLSTHTPNTNRAEDMISISYIFMCFALPSTGMSVFLTRRIDLKPNS